MLKQEGKERSLKCYGIVERVYMLNRIGKKEK
jgi:hypothetical protein